MMMALASGKGLQSSKLTPQPRHVAFRLGKVPTIVAMIGAPMMMAIVAASPAWPKNARVIFRLSRSASLDEAIDHCRKRNVGLNSQDPECMCVVDGPGCCTDGHQPECPCCDYAVVDLETARELFDDRESGLAPLIVTG